MTVIIQTRRDTAANWTSNDPIVLDGEMGFESDTNRFKIGDGATVWTSLPYVLPGVSYCELLPISASHASNINRVTTFTEIVDTDNYFDGGTSTSRIFAPWTGLYHIVYNILYSSASAGFLYSMSININRAGSTTPFHDVPSMRKVISYESISGPASGWNSGMTQLTAGDYIEVIFFQFGTTRTVDATKGGVQMRFIGL